MSKVFLGVISSGTVTIETATSIEHASLTKAATWIKYHRSGPYLDEARNELVRIFNTEPFNECDKLLMVDSDIEFTPEDIRLLDDVDEGIVTGVYHSNFGPTGVLPVVYEWTVKDGLMTMQPISEWDDGIPATKQDYDDPVIEVAGCGAGFLMIRRDVLDALHTEYGEPLPWFAEEVINGVHYGEDLCFNVRAKRLGFGTFCHRNAQVGHLKGIKLGGR